MGLQKPHPMGHRPGYGKGRHYTGGGKVKIKSK